MATAGARHTWVSSAMWNKAWFRRWNRATKLLWFYLVTCADNSCAGAYVMDPDVAKMKTGPGWTADGWAKACATLHPHVVFYDGGWVWIPGYLEHNSHGVNEKIAKGVVSIVNETPEQLRADFMAKYAATLGTFGVQIDTPSIPPRYPFDETSPPLPSPVNPVTTSSATRSGAAKKPRKYSDEEWEIGKAGASYATAQAQKHTGSPAPNGYKFGQFLGLFCERAKSEAEFDEKDCRDCVDEYFSRLRQKIADDAAKGKERHYMGSFAGFKGTLDSLASAVQKRRGA